MSFIQRARREAERQVRRLPFLPDPGGFGWAMAVWAWSCLPDSSEIEAGARALYEHDAEFMASGGVVWPPWEHAARESQDHYRRGARSTLIAARNLRMSTWE